MDKNPMQISLSIDYDHLSTLVVEKLRNVIQPQKSAETRTKIKGIRGLADYIPCSPSKAQDLKNKGIIPYSEVGNRVFFYSDEVDEALKMKGVDL